jgi:hypothetical protein
MGSPSGDSIRCGYSTGNLGTINQRKNEFKRGRVMSLLSWYKRQTATVKGWIIGSTITAVVGGIASLAVGLTIHFLTKEPKKVEKTSLAFVETGEYFRQKGRDRSGPGMPHARTSVADLRKRHPTSRFSNSAIDSSEARQRS